MKILWFSPLPPAKTDIANYTCRVMAHLTRFADVQLAYPDGQPAVAGAGVPISSLSPRDLNAADYCIYNLGNDTRFHDQIARCAIAHPGIVVLHDRSLHEFFLRHFNNGPARDSYLTHMVRWYGGAGFAAALDVRKGLIRPSALTARFPLFEPAVDRAMGVICHNPHVADEVRARFPKLPVLDLPLPYPALPAGDVQGDLGTPGREHVKLVMFGFMGANRRGCEILEAWAASPARARFELHLAGEMHDAARFMATAGRLGLKEQIIDHGFVPDAQLDAIIDDADIAINLRNPSMGEASGSLLRIWANGTAAVVTDTGWYGLLPPDSVWRIGAQSEARDLADLFGRLGKGQIDLISLTEAGAAALQSHDPAHYAQRLSQWLGQEADGFARQWSETALIEAVAGALATSLPSDFVPSLPAGFLGA